MQIQAESSNRTNSISKEVQVETMASDNVCTSNDDNDDVLSLFYRNHANGKPLCDRNLTVKVTNAIMMGGCMHRKKNDMNETGLPSSSTNDGDDQQRPLLHNVYGPGPLLLSDIPESCRLPVGQSTNKDKVVIGIDEAGRGSVIGPMVYGAAFWNLSEYETKIASSKGGSTFADSKKLTDTKRFDIMDNTILQTPEIGYAFRLIHANEISRNMTRSPAPYNLNQMSHDAAIQIIHAIIAAGVTNIDTCYIDTVGVAEQYQKKLETIFQPYDIKFVVESKADDKYPPCSAGSIGM